MFVLMHSFLKSLRWPKKLPRISEDIIGIPINMVLEQRQYVSRTCFEAKLAWLDQSSQAKCHHLFSRRGSWWFWRLGVQPWHQILLHVWAPGPRALRLPPAAISHSQGLQWSSDCGEDHRSQGHRENTSSNNSSANCHGWEFVIFVNKACCLWEHSTQG